MDKKQMKIELAEAAQRGIAEYLSTTRGANLFGSRASVTRPKMTEIEVAVPGPEGREYFSIKVSNPI